MGEDENYFEKLFEPPPYSSIAELMTADTAGRVSDEDLNRHLSWFLAYIIRSPADCETLAEPVVTYFATHIMQHDVWNGGFAQAVFNIPEWFDLAARGYERLRRPQAVERIRKAAAMSVSEADSVRWLKRRRAEIRAIFDRFSTSSLRALDAGLDEIGWDATSDRIALARRHREAFAQAKLK